MKIHPQKKVFLNHSKKNATKLHRPCYSNTIDLGNQITHNYHGKRFLSSQNKTSLAAQPLKTTTGKTTSAFYFQKAQFFSFSSSRKKVSFSPPLTTRNHSPAQSQFGAFNSSAGSAEPDRRLFCGHTKGASVHESSIFDSIRSEISHNHEHLLKCKPPVGAFDSDKLIEFDWSGLSNQILEKSQQKGFLVVPVRSGETVKDIEVKTDLTHPDQAANDTMGGYSVNAQKRLARKYTDLLKAVRRMDELDEDYLTRKNQRDFLKQISNRVGLEMPQFADEKEKELTEKGVIPAGKQTKFRVNSITGKVERVEVDDSAAAPQQQK